MTENQTPGPVPEDNQGAAAAPGSSRARSSPETARRALSMETAA
ncbi:hypothetical protein ACTAQI_09250 [Pseudarthrobacter sp. alpha12b]